MGRRGGDSRKFYQPLHEAILDGDWESVQRIHDSDREAVRGSITPNSNTALMEAIKSGQRIEFIQQLVNLLGNDLARQNKDGNTALHEAVIAGFVEAAKLLVRTDAKLLLIRNCDDYLPLHSAVDSGQREILAFFLGIDEVCNQQLDFQSHMLVLLAIDCRLFDVAIYLLRNPRLALSEQQTVSLLEDIAKMPSAFPSGTNLNIGQRFIYDRVPLDSKNFEDNRDESSQAPTASDDEENPANSSQAPNAVENPAEISPAPIGCDAMENPTESLQPPTHNNVENRVKSSQEPTIGCWRLFFSAVLRKLHAIDLWRLLKFIGVRLDSKNFEDTRDESSQAPTARDDEENRANSSQAPNAVENPAEISPAPIASDAMESRTESLQPPTHNNVENRVKSSQEPTIGCWRLFFSEVLRKLHAIDHWRLLKFIVPRVKQLQDKKLIHAYASDLVKDLCCELKKSSASSETLKSTFLLGAKHGIEEIIEEILVEFPDVIYCTDENEHSALHLAVIYRHDNVFDTILKQKSVRFSSVISQVDKNMHSVLHLAVMCRNEKIFNFIIQQKGLPKNLYWQEDHRGNNILHMAGQMPHQPQLEVVSGAVLQSQRELQWYKELEKLVPERARVAMNKSGMTPAMVFEKEHRRMINSEEQWAASVATAYLVPTTIIGTIAFAASIQAPGGNNGEGRPILYEKTAFKIFAASNALALYSAISTFLIFLSICTTRYPSIDSLYALPRRLIIGHIALFFSIASTVIAFDSALYLMFSQATQYVILTPMIIASCIPAISFAFLQFPIVLSMIKTTYGSTMFSPLNKKEIQKGRRF